MLHSPTEFGTTAKAGCCLLLEIWGIYNYDISLENHPLFNILLTLGMCRKRGKLLSFMQKPSWMCYFVDLIWLLPGEQRYLKYFHFYNQMGNFTQHLSDLERLFSQGNEHPVALLWLVNFFVFDYICLSLYIWSRSYCTN